MPDGGHDEETRKRIGELTEWLHVQVKRMWIALTVVALALLFGIGWNYKLGQDIQESRRDNMRDACLATNARHLHAIRELDVRLDKAKASASPAQQAQIEESREFSDALIDRMLPFTPDCDHIAAARTQP